MSVPTSNISFRDISNVFGGTDPISLSEYYANATPNYTSGVSGVPNIGSAISISQFSGKSKPVVSVSMILNTGTSYANSQVGIANGITALKILTITGFDIRGQTVSNVTISIYYRSGLITDANITTDTSLWILAGTTTLTYTTSLQQIPITTSIKVTANSNITFLIISTGFLSYSNGTVLGQTFVSNSDMNVNSGYGLSSFPAGTAFSRRNFNGNIRYTIP
jgi:hypothetical protein